MPAAKKLPTPSRSPQVRQIEFTPGQMIIAICTLIIFGLVCFMLGVLVNKLDTTFTAETTAAVAPAEQAATPLPGAPATPPRAQQTSPMPPEALRGPVASRDETAERPAPSQPRTVAPPSATRRAEAPEPAPAPRPATPPSAPEPPQEPVRETPVEPAATPAPERPAAPVLENVQPITPDEPEEPAQAPRPAPAPQAGGTAYGVQIASVSAEREEQARRALADAERVTEAKGQLVPSADGQLLRLIIGSFESRAEASRLMESMREHRQFEGCFVQTFTQPL